MIQIQLPYSIYRVPFTQGHEEQVRYVDLSKNSQLRRQRVHQVFVGLGKRQMKADVTKLLVIEGQVVTGDEGYLILDAVIRTRTATPKDDDGAVVGLYPARDAMAEYLEVNDRWFKTGSITFEKGLPERTVLTLRSAGEGPREV